MEQSVGLVEIRFGERLNEVDMSFLLCRINPSGVLVFLRVRPIRLLHLLGDRSCMLRGPGLHFPSGSKSYVLVAPHGPRWALMAHVYQLDLGRNNAYGLIRDVQERYWQLGKLFKVWQAPAKFWLGLGLW